MCHFEGREAWPLLSGHTGLYNWQWMMTESLLPALSGGESWAPTHTATQALKATWPLRVRVQRPYVNKLSLREAKA